MAREIDEWSRGRLGRDFLHRTAPLNRSLVALYRPASLGRVQFRAAARLRNTVLTRLINAPFDEIAFCHGRRPACTVPVNLSVGPEISFRNFPATRGASSWRVGVGSTLDDAADTHAARIECPPEIIPY